MLERRPGGTGVGERDVLEPDAVLEPVGGGPVAGDLGSGVLLEPDQAPRPVEPDAAQEADLPDRRAEVAGEPGAAGQHEQHGRRRRVEPGGDVDDRADVPEPEHRPAERVPHRAHPAGAGDQRVALLPRGAPARGQPLGDPEDPQLLGGRGGGVRLVEVPGHPLGLRAALAGQPLDTGAPPRREHGGQREHRQQREGGVHRHQQRDRGAEPQDPAGGGEQAHVQVVEHEDLVAQHREPVEVLRALLVGDGLHGRLQPGDVPLERDRHLVAEAALGAGREHPEEPRQHRREPEGDGGQQHQASVPVGGASTQQRQPQRDERVGQGGQQRQHERADDEPRLAVVAEPHEPPHRRERARQLVDRVSRGRHRPLPPRPPRPGRRTAPPAGRTSCGSARRRPSARRGCRARPPAPPPRRRSGRPGARWRTGATPARS